jgi:hypothetical protein
MPKRISCPFEDENAPEDVSAGCDMVQCEYYNPKRKYQCLILGLNKPESFSKTELADHLNIPPSTVVTHLAHAKNLLRLAMEMYEAQPNNEGEIVQTPALCLLTCLFPDLNPAIVLRFFRQNLDRFNQLELSPPEPFYNELTGQFKENNILCQK